MQVMYDLIKNECILEYYWLMVQEVNSVKKKEYVDVEFD